MNFQFHHSYESIPMDKKNTPKHILSNVHDEPQNEGFFVGTESYRNIFLQVPFRLYDLLWKFIRESFISSSFWSSLLEHVLHNSGKPCPL